MIATFICILLHKCAHVVLLMNLLSLSLFNQNWLLMLSFNDPSIISQTITSRYPTSPLLYCILTSSCLIASYISLSVCCWTFVLLSSSHVSRYDWNYWVSSRNLSSCYPMSAWNTAACLLNMVLTHRTNHTQYLMHIHLVPYTNTVVETNKTVYCLSEFPWIWMQT